MKLFFSILGLLLVIIVLTYLLSSMGQINFQKRVNKDINKILSEVDLSKNKTIEEEDIKDLPEPVKRWLKFSRVIGKEEIKTVRLKQTGSMKIKPDQSGMKTKAEQYFNITTPAFVWKARVNMLPLIYFAGEDKYYEGEGHMLIKVLSLFPVVNSHGEEIDQGTLTRYLGEMVWFPTAVLSEFITWETIDSNTAKATMSYKGTKGSGVFHFDESGKLKSYSCDRYYTRGDETTLEKYYVPVWDYKEFSGIKIPTKAKAIWRLDEGDFEYYDLKITEIEYNIKSSY